MCWTRGAGRLVNRHLVAAGHRVGLQPRLSVSLIAIFGVGVDGGAIFTGYLGSLCAGAAFIAIGIFASSLTDNQVLAFIIALAISGALFLLGRLGDLIPSGCSPPWNSSASTTI